MHAHARVCTAREERKVLIFIQLDGSFLPNFVTFLKGVIALWRRIEIKLWTRGKKSARKYLFCKFTFFQKIRQKRLEIQMELFSRKFIAQFAWKKRFSLKFPEPITHSICFSLKSSDPITHSIRLSLKFPEPTTDSEHFRLKFIEPIVDSDCFSLKFPEPIVDSDCFRLKHIEPITDSDCLSLKYPESITDSEYFSLKRLENEKLTQNNAIKKVKLITKLYISIKY
jgi:hypothetical protein